MNWNPGEKKTNLQWYFFMYHDTFIVIWRITYVHIDSIVFLKNKFNRFNKIKLTVKFSQLFERFDSWNEWKLHRNRVYIDASEYKTEQQTSFHNDGAILQSNLRLFFSFIDVNHVTVIILSRQFSPKYFNILHRWQYFTLIK
jgi:hypothetical protein